MMAVWKTWWQYGIKVNHQPFQHKSSHNGHLLFAGLSTSICARLAAPVLAIAELYAEFPGIITTIKEYK